MSATVAPIRHMVQKTANAVAAGTSTTFDNAVPSDRAMRIVAYVFLTLADAGHHLTVSGHLVAKGFYSNKNGTVSFTTAYSTSANPDGPSNLVTSEPQSKDTWDAGAGSPLNAVFSVSGTNARLTVTNNAATNPADVTVVFDIIVAGST